MAAVVRGWAVKAYVECNPHFGQGLHRVVRELKAHAPTSIEFVPTREAAELVVHHIVGVSNFSDGPNVAELITEDHAAGRRVGAVQYCLRTTEQPSTAWWVPHVWSQCNVVWSYYNLLQEVWNDGGVVPPGQAHRFYYRPLGVSDGFHAISHKDVDPFKRDFLVGTSGYVAESEAVDAWVDYAHSLGEKVFHLGPKLPIFDQFPGVVTHAKDLSDEELSLMWSRCCYVSGLRAVEGFELGAAEGVVCGARPVFFDRQHHRQWYRGVAIYLDERMDVRAELERLKVTREFAGTISPAVKTWARGTFSWARLVQGFWARLGIVA